MRPVQYSWFLLFLLHTTAFISQLRRNSYHISQCPPFSLLSSQQFLSSRRSLAAATEISYLLPSVKLRSIIPESLQRRTEESLDLHLFFEHVVRNIQTTLGQNVFYNTQFSDAPSVNQEYALLEELRSHKVTMPKITSSMNVWPLINLILSNAAELPSTENMVEFTHDIEYVIKLQDYLSQRSDLFSSFLYNITLPLEVISFFNNSFVLQLSDPQEVSSFSDLRTSNQNRRSKAMSAPRFVLNLRKFPSLLHVYQKTQDVQKKIEQELSNIVRENQLR
jgi:hypothetical protein